MASVTYVNADGLIRRLGRDEATVARGGTPSTSGEPSYVEVALDLTVLNTSTPTILLDTNVIPDGARPERVEVTVTEVSAGANANLHLGLIRQDRTTTYDVDGFIAAGDVWHEAAVGTRTVYEVGVAEAGALLGTVLANAGLLVAQADTAVFTAGELLIRVYFSIPKTAS